MQTPVGCLQRSPTHRIKCIEQMTALRALLRPPVRGLRLLGPAGTAPTRVALRCYATSQTGLAPRNREGGSTLRHMLDPRSVQRASRLAGSRGQAGGARVLPLAKQGFRVCTQRKPSWCSGCWRQRWAAGPGSGRPRPCEAPVPAPSDRPPLQRRRRAGRRSRRSQRRLASPTATLPSSSSTRYEYWPTRSVQPDAAGSKRSCRGSRQRSGWQSSSVGQAVLRHWLPPAAACVPRPAGAAQAEQGRGAAPRCARPGRRAAGGDEQASWGGRPGSFATFARLSV